MSKSIMVVARKYRLETPINARKGEYKKDGDKTDVYGKSRQVSREFVEERNAYANNELWIIDEEASSKLEPMRQNNIEARAKKQSRDNVTMADLVDVMAKNLKNPSTDNSEVEILKQQLADANAKLLKKETTIPNTDHPNGSWAEEKLKEYCDKQTPPIKYHHKAGSAKLLELINEKK